MTIQQNSEDQVCQISICLWESQVVRSFDKSPTWHLRCHVMVTCVMVSCLHPPYFSLNSAYWTNSGKREAPLADTFPIPIGWSVSYFNNNSVVPRTFFGFKGCLKMIARSFFPCGRKVQRDVKPHAIWIRAPRLYHWVSENMWVK